MILAADVGGTKTTVALFEERDDGGRPVHEATLPSGDFPTLEALVGRFLAGARQRGLSGAVEAACLGVAGPVVAGRVRATNLPWQVDAERLAEAIPARAVRLLNDLEAAGHGVLGLPPEALVPLQAGEPRPGHRCLIAAGTGLGEAILAWTGERYHVLASEGGHASFAPTNELEADLWRYLASELGHVSWERVLSGPGLVNIYRFLRDAGIEAEPPWLADRLAAGDPAEAISVVALAEGHPLCVRALDLFVSLYGAEAGNLALKALALGGTYVGGGIAPKIRARMAAGAFARAFRDKGRLEPLLAGVPVWLVLEPRVPLLGALEVARRELLGPGR